MKLKPSELMLNGFELAGGKQAKGWYWKGGPSNAPRAVCALGAIRLADVGDAALSSEAGCLAFNKFFAATGYCISEVNDKGISIPDIAGILAAEGL